MDDKVTPHEVLELVRGLPAAHPARRHALALVRSLGERVLEPFPELWLTAAWHFAAWAIASDPSGLHIQRSGHSGGMAADLVVHSEEWDRCAVWTWNTGTAVLSSEQDDSDREGDYAVDFVVNPWPVQKRLMRLLRGSESPNLGHPRVQAALVLRAATDPALGWDADVPSGEYTADATGAWELGPPGADPVLAVDVARGLVRNLTTNEEISPARLSGSLQDPLNHLSEIHDRLRALLGHRPRRTTRTPVRSSRPDSGPHRILHADWGVSAKKRAVAVAIRDDAGWILKEVVQWNEDHRAAVVDGGSESLLAGFDFPIGVPRAYAQVAGIPSFPGLLRELGAGKARWNDFTSIAQERDEIAVTRPFYPRSAPKGSGKSRADLEAALGLEYRYLLRECERATPSRPEASSLFWLVGAKQVGRGALSGWTEAVAPALLRGARLWPFDGVLSELVSRPGVTIAETYPAEFYGHLGFPSTPRWSKTKRADRARMMTYAIEWARENDVRIESELTTTMLEGFDMSREGDGEDPFDAVVGALGMIQCVQSCTDTAPRKQPGLDVEGWILGQEPGTSDTD